MYTDKKDKWLWDIAVECLEEMYQASVPAMSFKELLKKAENKELYEEKYWQQHYLPQKLFNEILEDYKATYNLEDYFHQYTDILKEYLLNGGKEETTVDDPNSFTGKTRTIVDTPKLPDVIGEEKAEKVKELIDKCQKFYRLDAHRTRNFDFTISNYAPNSNAETVKRYWKEKGLDLDLNDESIMDSYYEEKYGESGV